MPFPLLTIANDVGAHAKTTNDDSITSFVYVYVKNLGFTGWTGQTLQGGAHLLLIGHPSTRTGRQSLEWGCPGGHQDVEDSFTASMINSTQSNGSTSVEPGIVAACREFAEEFMGAVPSYPLIWGLIHMFTARPHEFVSNSNGTKHSLHVVFDSALQFEMLIGLPRRTLAQKQACRLSNETKGYQYVKIQGDRLVMNGLAERKGTFDGFNSGYIEIKNHL